MICKVCNAAIDDNAQVCPFCGANVTVDVDPGMSSFPDPAAPQGGIDLSKPASDPTADDLGLSEPAQYTDPMAGQNTQQPYNNAAPSGQSVQPSYNQNTYSQPSGGYNFGNPEQEKEAQTIMTLGLVALIVGFCCCAIVGPICGGIGLSKYNKIQSDLGMLSEDAQKKANNGRILCIIGIVVGAISMIVGFINGINGTYSQVLQNFQN